MSKGFTLIEILIVLGIIAILAAIVLVAINPGRQFAEARNTQRLSNVTTILNAVGQRIADTNGTFSGSVFDGFATSTCPTITPGIEYDISSGSAANDIDLSCLTPTYIPGGLPYDPSAPGASWSSSANYDTHYHLLLDQYGRYTMSAPNAELNKTISATR